MTLQCENIQLPVFVLLFAMTLSACAAGGGRLEGPVPMTDGTNAGQGHHRSELTSGTVASARYRSGVLTVSPDTSVSVIGVAADNSPTVATTNTTPSSDKDAATSVMAHNDHTVSNTQPPIDGLATSDHYTLQMVADLNDLSATGKDLIVDTIASAATKDAVSSADTETQGTRNTSVTQSSQNDQDNPYWAAERNITDNWAIDVEYVDDGPVFETTHLPSGRKVSTETEPQPPGHLTAVAPILGSPNWKGVEHFVTSQGRRLYSVLYSDIENNETNYLAAGFWIRVPDLDNPLDIETPSFGTAVSGSDPFQLGNIEPLGGHATYSGEAAGLYVIKNTAPTFRYFNADVMLTADFVHNRIWGVVTAGIDVATGDSIFDGLALEPARIQTENASSAEIQNYKSAFFQNQVTGVVNGQYFGGQWGGQFFGNGTSPTDIPDSVAGTFGASARDAHGALIGTFGTYFRGHTLRIIRDLNSLSEEWKTGVMSGLSRAASRDDETPLEGEVFRQFADDGTLVVSSAWYSDSDSEWNTSVTQSSRNELNHRSPSDNWTISAHYDDDQLVFERTNILEEHESITTDEEPDFPGYRNAISPIIGSPRWKGVEQYHIDDTMMRPPEFPDPDDPLGDTMMSPEFLPDPEDGDLTDPGPGDTAPLPDVENDYQDVAQGTYSVFLSDIENAADADYLALGYWVEIALYPEVGADFGAAAGGNDPFRVENIEALEGSATYEGNAAGLYAAKEPTTVFRHFNADVKLTADFNDNLIWGVVIDGRDVATDGQVFAALALEPAEIQTDQAAFFSDQVTAAVNGRYYDGYWGGQFFSNGEQSTDFPGSVAGTFSARAKNDHAESLVGVFGTYLQP